MTKERLEELAKFPHNIQVEEIRPLIELAQFAHFVMANVPAAEVNRMMKEESEKKRVRRG